MSNLTTINIDSNFPSSEFSSILDYADSSQVLYYTAKVLYTGAAIPWIGFYIIMKIDDSAALVIHLRSSNQSFHIAFKAFGEWYDWITILENGLTG